MKIKLLPYQIDHIQSLLDSADYRVEVTVFDKYNISSLDQINFSDYDSFVNDIMSMNSRANCCS